jgi:aminoglycoside/choline kinase family phosphotransferase
MESKTNTSAGVIARIEQISPSWLTTVLGEDLLAENDRVTSCQATQIAIGEGFAGRLYRLFLTFDKGSPSTLIAKLATDNDSMKDAINTDDLYREARFYEQIAPQVGIEIPKVYHSAYGDNELVIIMEDLGEIELGAAGLGAEPAQTERAFSAIAKFHTQWWNHEVTNKTWLAPAAETLDPDELARGLEVSRQKYGDQYPYLAKCVSVFLKHLPNLPLGMAKPPPLTLVHGDFHRKNVHFRTDGSPVIFDWQAVETNAPVTDVTNWLLTNLSVEDRRTHEFRLLKHYHASLGKECSANYSFRKLKADYRQALVSAAVRMYYILELVDLDIEGGDDLAPVYLERIEQAAKDHKLLVIFRALGILVLMTRLLHWLKGKK